MQDMADEAAAQRPVGLKTQRCISQFSEIWCRHVFYIPSSVLFQNILHHCVYL